MLWTVTPAPEAEKTQRQVQERTDDAIEKVLKSEGGAFGKIPLPRIITCLVGDSYRFLLTFTFHCYREGAISNLCHMP